MPNQIPSAFLIRALAQRPSEHCDRCGHRMFVKLASGLCPSCRADRPVQPIEYAVTPIVRTEPFAPLVGARSSWQHPGFGRRMRELVARTRRSAHELSAS